MTNIKLCNSRNILKKSLCLKNKKERIREKCINFSSQTSSSRPGSTNNGEKKQQIAQNKIIIYNNNNSNINQLYLYMVT